MTLAEKPTPGSTETPTALVVATVPLTSTPRWATAQRALFALLDEAWPIFEKAFCLPDGSIRYHGRLSSRDGGDDFFETFFNWPAYYLLGGSAEILTASTRHWAAVTRQLAGLGIVDDEYEIGYDWFHQGESLLFFYYLSAASPEEWRARAARFAELYVDPANGNYDEALNIIKAPHTGSGGARVGLSESDFYPWLADEARKYGFPLDWMNGPSVPHTDLAPDPRLGTEMHERLGRGDVVGNLSASGLVLNAYVLTGDERYATWITRYVSAWKERAERNGGLVPDNVGLDGVVGSQLDGRWYGGHYGWSWPHGIYSVGQATAVGALAAAVVSGDESFLDLPREQYDAVIARGRVAPFSESDSSVKHWWSAHLGEEVTTPTFLVPYRFSDKGWFDWNPVQVAIPFALWHFSADDGDLERLRELRRRSGTDWRIVRPYREKEEGGHDEAWFTYLEGDNPEYPELILEAAEYQVRRRLALIRSHAGEEIDEADIHIWQLVQPIVTEALTQTTSGGPQVIYNGGQQQSRIRWFDLKAERPGLPKDVAALVSSIAPERTTVEVLNLSPTDDQQLVLQAGGFAEHEILSVTYDETHGEWAGSYYSYIGDEVPTTTRTRVVGGPHLIVDLPAGSRVTLTLSLALRAHKQTYASPWETAAWLPSSDAAEEPNDDAL